MKALILLPFLLFQAACVHGAEYQVGAAREDITPKEPILLAGWKGRNKPVQAVAQPLFVRVVAIKDAAGTIALIASVDSIGFGAGYADQVAKRIEALGVAREQFVLCSTHDHMAPHVAGWSNYSWPMANPEQRAVIERYTQLVSDQIVKASSDAIKGLAPAQLGFGRGTADFAKNRRSEDVSDHDLPFLRVQSEGGQARAFLFSYACHGVTGDRSRISGDWPGLASEYLEAAHPGAVAACVIGCAGDQDSAQSTQQCAQAVQKAAAAVENWRPIHGAISARFVRVSLPCEKAGAQGLSYPIQTLTFGQDLSVIFLADEATADYSLRLKRELAPEKIMVVAYANEVAAYIPSLRVLNKGGYEAEEANRRVYGVPGGKFGQTVEDVIIGQVRSLVPPSFVRVKTGQ